MKGYRVFLLKNSMLLGNFISNLIAVFIIDTISHKSLSPPTPEILDLANIIDWLYIPFAFLAIFIATLIYERPIRMFLNATYLNKGPLPEGAVESARRRLLNEPFILIAFNLSVWFLAAVVYPAVFYLHGAHFRIIVRAFFQTTLLGIITAICAFFVLERIMQNRMVPVLFPYGGLYATPGTIRIQIKTRLVALLFACNLIPFFAILVMLSGTYVMKAEPERILELLRPTFLINSLIFMTVGLIVTFLVGKNLTQPFGEIIQVLKNIRSGRLDGKVQVTTNDEVGYTGDVINEMTVGLRERASLRHSLELARDVQQNLLPKSFPDLKGIDIAGRSIYCDQTGGDYFDFLEFQDSPQKKVGLVVGDVSGHGVPSALLMATARAFIRLRSSMPGNAAQVLSDVNRQLTRDVGYSGQFMTLFYLILDPAGKRLQWARAGHDPAILYDPESDSFETLHGAGMALGVDEHWEYENNEKAGLRKGQIILIGTDGIWEAGNEMGEMFGKHSLYKIIRGKADGNAPEIVDAVMDALKQFQEGKKAEDDITLIVVKLTDDLSDE